MDYSYSQLILAAISAMAAAIQIWQAERSYKTTKQTYQRVYAEALKSPNILHEAEILSHLLPQHILKQLAARVDHCWAHFESVISLPGDYPREAETRLAKCICEELRGIKRLNGTIPEGKLRDWWNEYGCGPYIS